jgi:hypothetical protein
MRIIRDAGTIHGEEVQRQKRSLESFNNDFIKYTKYRLSELESMQLIIRGEAERLSQIVDIIASGQPFPQIGQRVKTIYDLMLSEGVGDIAGVIASIAVNSTSNEYGGTSRPGTIYGTIAAADVSGAIGGAGIGARTGTWQGALGGAIIGGTIASFAAWW